MQVKICPNCSTENKPESEKCAKCDWSLADVQASAGRAAQAPPPGPPMPTSAPARQGSSAGMIIIILIIIAGAAFAGWWFLMRGGGGPEATVDRFAAAVKAGDIEAMKSTMSKGTNSLLAMSPGAPQSFMDSMKSSFGEAGMQAKKTSYEGENAIVELGGGKMPGAGGAHEFVLIKEDGEWKIDLAATMGRMMKKMNMPMPSMPSHP